MGNEQQSSPEGNNKRHADSRDAQGGAEIVRAGDGGGAPIESLDDGGRQPEEGDGRGIINAGASITYSRSAPLPTVAEYEGYERVLPGSADHIVTMAEKSLDSQIEDTRAARAIEAADHKAENVSMVIASVAFSFLPWVAFGAAIICAAFGNNVGTFIGSAVGVISAGPQIIDSVKRKRK